MLYNNEYVTKLTEPTYEIESEGKIAKVPGMDDYSYPELGNPGNKKKFPGKLVTTNARFNPLFRFSVADGILSNADFSTINKLDYQPTITNLLKAENTNNPALRYSPGDFMHCKDAPIVSGYHMITLRRFAYPIADNLATAKAAADNNIPALDAARLVTYSTEDKNKLSEIMTMSFGLNWRELTADFWSPEIIGNESGASGLLGTLMSFTNPMYMTQKGLGKNAVNVDPHYDQNRTYGPVDTITKTHIRDRGLNFNQDINLTFEYDLRSYDSVNPKAALIDLISNILVVTFNDGKFWGGATLWRGMARGANSKYISTTDAFKASSDFNGTVDYYKKQLTSLSGGSNGWQSIINLGKMLVQGLEGIALDKLVSTIGRPTVAVANSLLSGEPVGMWHLTIGNPYRPIMTIGNLILTNSVLSFGDQLGHDGFPNSIKLTCSLKHAKPRSRSDIEMMFNQGAQRTYWQPTKEQFAKQINGSYAYKTWSEDLVKELSNEIFSFIDNPKLAGWR